MHLINSVHTSPMGTASVFSWSIWSVSRRVRSETCVQAALPPSDSACPRQGPFALRALPRFFTTMGLSDSRHGQLTVIDSRQPLVPNHRHAGSPRFLDVSFRARSPQPPRGALQLHLLVASPQVTGFTISGRLATPICVTRPNRVRFR